MPKNQELNSINVFNNNTEIVRHDLNPIFIIGVPRCGSTLVEKIIASGSQYVEIGEETGILSTFVKQKIIQQKAIYSRINDMRTELIER